MPLFLAIVLVSAPARETNAAVLVGSAMLTAYQTLVSPAQGDVCNFEPSCSRFARIAIRQHGLLLGMIMTADRLIRCNPAAAGGLPDRYAGIRNGKIYDPVENNDLRSCPAGPNQRRGISLRIIE